MFKKKLPTTEQGKKTGVSVTDKKRPASKTYFKIFLVSILAIGLSAAIKLSLQKQDLSKQAKISDGPIEISTQFIPAKAFQPASLNFFINTHGQAIEGVQLGLAIMTDEPNLIQSIEGEVTQASGLSQIQPPLFVDIANGNGKKVLIAAIAEQALQGGEFSTNTPVQFASIKLSTGSQFHASVEFDPVLSKATHIDQFGQVNNLLGPISNFEIK